MGKEIILFETKDHSVTLKVPVENETVWLNRNQMAELFDRDVKTIGKHISNALKEELDNSTVAKFATVQKEGEREVSRQVEYYNLDMIISVGYRVKSQRGVEFYPSLEEKAANLLYFVTKNHSFSDGNKRIAATMFLYFLDRNNALFIDGAKRIDDYTLVALTIMIAESKPDEKEMMIKVIMNCMG